MRFVSRHVFAVVLVLSLVPQVLGAVVHDEASMGDLSDNSGAPTNLGFFVPGAGGSLRSNSVLGQTDSGAPDIFTFEIASGNELRSLTLSNYDQGDTAMFVAMAAGDQFPNDYFEINDPFFFDTSGWLGGRVVGVNEEGKDILGLIGDNLVTQIGTGFAPPLGAGQYTFYLQQSGPRNFYTLDFNVAAVTAVPEPSTSVALSAMAVGCWGLHRRRKRKQAKPSLLQAGQD